MTLIFSIIALVVGGGLGYLFGGKKGHAGLKAENLVLAQANADLNGRLANLAKEKDELNFRVGQLQEFDSRFKVIASEVLKEQKGQFKQDFEEKNLGIDKAVKGLTEKIDHLERERAGQVEAMKTNVEQVLNTARRMETGAQKLESALTSSGGVRGEWGEGKLEKLLNECGFTEGIDYQTQQTIEGEDGATLRPDVTVSLPSGLKLAVDSKAVWGEYLKAMEAQDETSKQARIGKLVQDMRQHVQKLSSKQYEKHLDPRIPYVIMFVPGEAAIRAAFDADPGLYQDAQAKRVLIASPATIIPLILLIQNAWKNHRSNENAVKLAGEIIELGSRLKTFFTHVNGIGASLSASTKRFNEAVGSWDVRVAPKLDHINSLGGNMQLAERLAPIEVEPRASGKLLEIPEA